MLPDLLVSNQASKQTTTAFVRSGWEVGGADERADCVRANGCGCGGHFGAGGEFDRGFIDLKGVSEVSSFGVSSSSDCLCQGWDE
jgi:hypothetical protein